MTSTVLKDLAILGKFLPPRGYLGYNAAVTAQAVYDPVKAKEYLAKAGYPYGKGVPKVEIWHCDQGGHNAAISAPMLQYLQAQFKKSLGITMNTKTLPQKDWMAGSLEKRNSLFLAPCEYDYIASSNFYRTSYNGGRQDYHI